MPLSRVFTVNSHFLFPELIPEALKAALIDHLVEFLLIRVEFETPFTDLVLLDLDVDCG
jgi:hypothetical protein